MFPDQLKHRSKQARTIVLGAWPRLLLAPRLLPLLACHCARAGPCGNGVLFGDLAPLQRRGPPQRFPDQKRDGTRIELSRNRCKTESHRPYAGGSNPHMALTRLCCTLVTRPGGLHPRQDFELERRRQQTDRQTGASKRPPLSERPPGDARKDRPYKRGLFYNIYDICACALP